MSEDQRSLLKSLISKGKEQGYLTFAEVNDHLPDDLVDPEQIEDIIAMFNDMGISVHEQAPDSEDILLSDNAVTTNDDDEAKRQPLPWPRPSRARSGARPIRCACTCGKWAQSSC